MQGHCLCSTVQFTLAYSPTRFYRCHCSLCRRQTGGESNYATLVPRQDFSWSAGEASIHYWKKASGYRNDFCKDCGSTVPNPLAEGHYFWVPLGLLENMKDYDCVADFCLPQATQAVTGRLGQAFSQPVASLEALLAILHLNR